MSSDQLPGSGRASPPSDAGADQEVTVTQSVPSRGAWIAFAGIAAAVYWGATIGSIIAAVIQRNAFWLAAAFVGLLCATGCTSSAVTAIRNPELYYRSPPGNASPYLLLFWSFTVFGSDKSQSAELSGQPAKRVGKREYNVTLRAADVRYQPLIVSGAAILMALGLIALGIWLIAVHVDRDLEVLANVAGVAVVAVGVLIEVAAVLILRRARDPKSDVRQLVTQVTHLTVYEEDSGDSERAE